jgi:hypothetical protein
MALAAVKVASGRPCCVPEATSTIKAPQNRHHMLAENRYSFEEFAVPILHEAR